MAMSKAIGSDFTHRCIDTLPFLEREKKTRLKLPHLHLNSIILKPSLVGLFVFHIQKCLYSHPGNADANSLTNLESGGISLIVADKTVAFLIIVGTELVSTGSVAMVTCKV